MKTIVVLGASEKPERKSNEAARLLIEGGYRVIPINPSLDTLEGVPVAHSLSEALEEPDALAVYVNAGRSSAMRDDIVRLAPGTVIFNPGAENDELETYLSENGIRTIHACTIVLLKTGQFEKAIL